MTSSNVCRVVLVEDDAALRENHRLALEKAGYRVVDFSAAETALAACQKTLPDLVLIGIGLGNDSEAGFGLCQSLRSLSDRLPILFLTARDSEIDVISGLRRGADDYLTKDISLQQVITRVSTLLRRVDALMGAQIATVQKVAELTLDHERLLASWNGLKVQLTVTEFWLVASLANTQTVYGLGSRWLDTDTAA